MSSCAARGNGCRRCAAGHQTGNRLSSAYATVFSAVAASQTRSRERKSPDLSGATPLMILATHARSQRALKGRHEQRGLRVRRLRRGAFCHGPSSHPDTEETQGRQDVGFPPRRDCRTRSRRRMRTLRPDPVRASAETLTGRLRARRSLTSGPMIVNPRRNPCGRYRSTGVDMLMQIAV